MKTKLECVVCGKRVPSKEILLGQGRKVAPGQCVCGVCQMATRAGRVSPSPATTSMPQSSSSPPSRSSSSWAYVPSRRVSGVRVVALVLSALLLVLGGASFWWWLGSGGPRSPRSQDTAVLAEARAAESRPSTRPAETQPSPSPVEERQEAPRTPEGSSLTPLGPAEIERLKAATVYVRSSYGVGSGFLFRRAATEPILIATNQHVIAIDQNFFGSGPSPAERIEVVLRSGSSRQEVAEARLSALSPKDDLAILRLAGKSGERSFLDLSREKVFETQPVRVVGFPFGDMLERRSSFPSPTLATGTVSSLRYDDQGVVERIQLDADVNPGNSGGPVVDRQGRVVGVAVETVLATNISFMIPVEKLRRMLDGSVSGYDHSLRGSLLRVQLRVEDPLHNLAEVGLNVQLSERPAKTAASEPDPSAGKELVSKAPSGRNLVLEASLSRYRGRAVWIQPWFRRGDVRHGLTPLRVDLRAGVGVAERSDGTVDGEGRSTGPESSGWLGDGSKGSAILQRRAEVTRVGLGGIDQTFRDARFREVLQVGSHVVDLTFSPDGKYVYLLEEGGTLRKVLTASLHEERRLVLETVASSVAWSDEGLVVGLPSLREVVVVSSESLKPLKAIRVPDAASVASAAGLHMAYTIPRGGRTLGLVDLALGAAIGELHLNDLRRGSECDKTRNLRNTITAIAVPEGGQHLLMACHGVLIRFRIAGKRLVCEEVGPDLGTNRPERRLSVSPDGLYVALATDSGNSSLSGGEKIPGAVHIFPVENFSEPVVTVQTMHLLRLGFDAQRGRVYTAGQENKLRVYNAGGVMIDEYSFLSRGEYLKTLHGSPRGDVLFLRTAERLLWMRFE